MPERIVASQAEDAPPPDVDHGKWAICCSGVGVRAATYCLGALQGLDGAGLAGRARWLLGVSGGSYIVASYTLVGHTLEQQSQTKKTAAMQASAGTQVPGNRDGEDHAGNNPPAYGLDTPEERYLRNTSVVLGVGTRLVGILSTLLGAASIFVLAGALVFAFSHAWGWLLAWQGVLTWTGGKVSASVTAWTWWLLPVAAATCTAVLLVHWRVTLASRGAGQGLRRARQISQAAAVTVGLSLVMLAEPLLIAWLFDSTGAVGSMVHFFSYGGADVRLFAALAGLVVAVTAVTWFGQRQLVKLSFRSGADGGALDFFTEMTKAITDSIPGWPGSAVAALLYLVMLTFLFAAQLAAFLAAGLIIAVGALAALVWSAAGARAGFTLTQLWPVIGAFAIVMLARIATDVNRLSSHDLTRWRLADAYAVTRRAAAETNPGRRQDLLADAALTRLSELSKQQGGTEPVICATARINPDRGVPSGGRAFRLTFDPACVTLHGAPSDERQETGANTRDYEHLVGHTRLTLFDLVTISDSPSVLDQTITPVLGGAVTRGVYRILLTATGLRRGFWLPHPSVVSQARTYLDEHHSLSGKDRWRWLALLWYMLPRPHGDRSEDRSTSQEARLWAHALELREACTRPQSSRRTRFLAALLWRTMQPTLGLLWAAAVGHGSYRATWMHVTDAETSDNLGLVEALHRGATNILILDACRDWALTWFSLGKAMVAASVDEGVQIYLDPTVMTASREEVRLRPGQVVRPWAFGTFARDQALPGTAARPGHEPLPAEGGIWVCKPAWWREAPWDIQAYAQGHPGYPDRILGEELYDVAEFDAYRKLGIAAIHEMSVKDAGFRNW